MPDWSASQLGVAVTNRCNTRSRQILNSPHGFPAGYTGNHQGRQALFQVSTGAAVRVRAIAYKFVAEENAGSAGQSTIV